MTSIRLKLVLLTVASVLFVALLAGASAIWVTVSESREQAQERLVAYGAQFESEIDRLSEELDEALHAEAGDSEIADWSAALYDLAHSAPDPAFRDMSRNLRIRLIEHLRQTLRNKDFDLAALYGPQGLAAYGDRQGPGLVVRDRADGPRFLAPTGAAALVRYDDHLWREEPPPAGVPLRPPEGHGGIHFMRRDDGLYVEGSLPLRVFRENPENYELLPVTAATILFRKRIESPFLQGFFRHLGVPVDLFAPDGRLLASSHPNELLGERRALLDEPLQQEGLRVVRRSDGTYYARARPYLRDGRRVAVIVAYTSRDAVIERTRRLILLQGAGLGLGLLLAAGFALLIARLIAGPVVEVARQMRDIAATRDFGRRVTVTGRDEIGTLAHSFNEMAARLQEADTALRAAEEKYRGIFVHATEGIFQSTLDRRVLAANPALIRMFGFDSEEEVQRLDDLTEAVYQQPEDRHQLLEALRREGRVEGFEVALKRKDGSCFTGLLNARLAQLREGEAPVIEGVVQDITARRERERAEQAREAAEAATRAKTLFLATMSHEIRTPMNVIVGMTELLLEEELEPRRRHYLEVAHSAGEGLLSLINDILDLSRIEAGQLDLDPAPFALAGLIDGVVKIFLHPAREKGLELAVELKPGLPPWLLGDASRIRQVLINLLGNAVKFTPSGRVRLQVRPGSAADRCRFEISDSGIGIAPERQKRLFQPFSQGDAGMARRYGGTGLGLSICKHIVTRMGGEIGFHSVAGEGSRFHFEVPLPAAEPLTGEIEPAVEEPSPEGGATGLRVLVAEDSEDNITLLQAYLRNAPHRVEFVRNGVEAVRRFREGNFDLVLMDVQMPEMDGYTATREIRAFEKERRLAATPIYALSAHAFTEARQHSLEAGCDDHLTKPIKKRELLRFLEGIAGRE